MFAAGFLSFGTGRSIGFQKNWLFCQFLLTKGILYDIMMIETNPSERVSERNKRK